MKKAYSRILNTTGSPRAAVLLAPVIGGLIGYGAHRLASGVGYGLVERMLGPDAARNIAGGSPWTPALAGAALAGGLAAYEWAPHGNSEHGKPDWNSWDQYKNMKGLPTGLEKLTQKKASFTPAEMEPGFFNALADVPADKDIWHMNRPTVGIKQMHENIWALPDVSREQRKFLQMGLDEAARDEESGLTSLHNLGTGYKKTIEDFGLLGTAANAAVNAGAGFLIGNVAGTLLGGSKPVRRALGYGSAAAMTINSLPVLRDLL
jgi:hypothetical protein